MEATNVEPRLTQPATNGHPPMESHANSPKRARTRTILIIAGVVLVVFAVFLGLGILSRSRQSHDLASTAAQVADTPPKVYVVHPVASGAPDWSLPGTTQAIQDAIIYARVSGYLIKRYVDIGDRVKA